MLYPQWILCFFATTPRKRGQDRGDEAESKDKKKVGKEEDLVSSTCMDPNQGEAKEREEALSSRASRKK